MRGAVCGDECEGGREREGAVPEDCAGAAGNGGGGRESGESE